MTRRVALALLALAACCDPARAQEVARLEVTRPATVIVERTAEGGVRLVVEYRPMGPPKPSPEPDAPTPAGVLARATGQVAPEHRDAFLASVKANIDWILASDWVTPAEVGATLATRVVVELGIPATAGALALAADLDKAADPMGRLRGLASALGGGQ